MAGDRSARVWHPHTRIARPRHARQEPSVLDLGVVTRVPASTRVAPRSLGEAAEPRAFDPGVPMKKLALATLATALLGCRPSLS